MNVTIDYILGNEYKATTAFETELLNIVILVHVKTTHPLDLCNIRSMHIYTILFVDETRVIFFTGDKLFLDSILPHSTSTVPFGNVK